MPNLASNLLVVGLIAVAPAIAQPAGKIRVCVAAGNETPTLVVLRAEGIASRMFATAGVAVEWRCNSAYRESPWVDTVNLEFATDTPEAYRPGALAYATPYQGSEIVVMFDRIEHSARKSSQVSDVLAHVMTHEITHLLQGIAQHSETGVMKARWSPHDLDLMTYQTLPFTAEDIELIQRGLIRRAETPLR
jgi:hypothetical protein